MGVTSHVFSEIFSDQKRLEKMRDAGIRALKSANCCKLILLPAHALEKTGKEFFGMHLWDECPSGQSWSTGLNAAISASATSRHWMQAFHTVQRMAGMQLIPDEISLLAALV